MDIDEIINTLKVELQTSNGIEIRAKLSKNYNCMEFTLNSNHQPVFISPWMQFEPSEMSDERARIAHEIVHRATNYKNLLDRVTRLESQLRASQGYSPHLNRVNRKTFTMWGEERVKFGLPNDFRDIKEWPPEMLSNYS